MSDTTSSSAPNKEAVQPDGQEEQTQKISLDVGGMTRASCASHVEEAVNGMVGAGVNLATERETVRYDRSSGTSCEDMSASVVETVQQSGYNVAIVKTTLHVGEMACASFVSSIEDALRAVPGIVDRADA